MYYPRSCMYVCMYTYIDAQTCNNPAKILILALEHSTTQYLHFTHNGKSVNMSHNLLHIQCVSHSVSSVLIYFKAVRFSVTKSESQESLCSTQKQKKRETSFIFTKYSVQKKIAALATHSRQQVLLCRVYMNDCQQLQTNKGMFFFFR